MSWGESVRVETPEQIDFDLEVAGPGSRLVAQLIDWSLKWAILAAVVFGALILLGFARGGLGDLTETTRNVLIGLLVAGAFVFFFGYDIYYEGTRNGQTPGKRRAGIRVVRDGGGPIDMQAAAVRNLVGLADFLPFGYTLGGLVMLLNARGQRLGDLAAGTVVIRERHTAVPDDRLGWVLQRAGSAHPFSREQLARCSPNDLHVLESYFNRYGALDPAPRWRLTANLCDLFLKRTGYQPPEPLRGPDPSVDLLAALYRDLDAQRRHG